MRTAPIVVSCALVLVVCADGGREPGASAAPSTGDVAATPTPTETAATTTATTTPPTVSTTVGPISPSTTVTEIVGELPQGFELVAARVTEADGSTCDLCLWLAETPDQHRLGMMFATELGPADGMAFRYDRPHTGTFWMKNTVLPLSIAFFAPDGGYMADFDMDPCTTQPCRRYGTSTGFMVAVETLQGGLAEIGMTPGSTLELLDAPCAGS